MKTIAIILLCLPLTVFAREVIIDPYQLERHQNKEAETERCNAIDISENVFARRKCWRDVNTKYKVEFPNRGTNEYAKKVYFGLTKEQGKAKIDELQSLQQKARENIDHGDLQPGEITAGQLMAEKWWIYEHVLGLDPQRLYIRY